MSYVCLVTTITNMRDYAAYEDYSERAYRIVYANKGKYILASHKHSKIEAVVGSAPDIVNIAVFPDRASFDAFYYDEEYQRLMGERGRYCDVQMLVIEKEC